MNRKTVVVLLLLTLAILVGAPESFARPQYLTNLSKVYGSGSCGTCHVMTSGSGQRDFNGTFGQHNSNGTFERRSYNRTSATRSSNGTFRQRNSNRTLQLNSYGTLFEKQPEHAADPSAALMAIGSPPAAAPDETAIPAAATASDTGIKAAPGFGIVVPLIGLFVWTLLSRRRNK